MTSLFNLPTSRILSAKFRPMARLEGDELPVSIFTDAKMEDGTFTGTTAYEKRGIVVTEWQIDNCIQCNQCSRFHAVIRPAC